MLAVLMIFMPAGLRRLVGQKVMGWDVHPTAHIGRSLIMVGHLSMGPETNIGSLNVIRGLAELRLERGAAIATRNWIFAHPMAQQVFTNEKRRSCLLLGEWAKITNSHIIDCTDRVELGAHAGLAGFRTQVLTHSLDMVRDVQVCAPVEIGDYVAVMSGCILLAGTRVPAYSIVSAGSVINTKLTKERTFYRGNPAEAIRELPKLKYFDRGEAEARRYTM